MRCSECYLFSYLHCSIEGIVPDCYLGARGNRAWSSSQQYHFLNSILVNNRINRIDRNNCTYLKCSQRLKI